MALNKFNGLELPAAADMHVHLREGVMMELVTYAQFLFGIWKTH